MTMLIEFLRKNGYIMGFVASVIIIVITTIISIQSDIRVLRWHKQKCEDIKNSHSYKNRNIN
jgi:hypothetical protein